MSLINNNDESLKQHDFQQSVLTMQKSVTITVTPQRSNSLDYLNFEEKRQLIASSLSLSDILSNQVAPVVAQAAKDVAAASSVIGKDGRTFDRIRRVVFICCLLLILARTIREINLTAPRIKTFPFISPLISSKLRFSFKVTGTLLSSSEKAQRDGSPDDQPQHRLPNASSRKKKQI
jgi:hypothetical protein